LAKCQFTTTIYNDFERKEWVDYSCPDDEESLGIAMPSVTIFGYAATNFRIFCLTIYILKIFYYFLIILHIISYILTLLKEALQMSQLLIRHEIKQGPNV
jgi:hypothetical protein